MKQNAPKDFSLERLQNHFWRWLSLSVLAVALLSAAPALSADVFIDEGDTDFAPTPVTEGYKAPASEDMSDVSDPATSLDSAIGELAPPVEEPSTADTTNDDMMYDAPVAAPVVAEPAPKAVVKKAKVEKKAAKKAQKASKKKADKKSAKKGGKKTGAKKSKTKASVKSAKARKVASNVKFAGGQYAVTSRDCPLESSPGAGDVVGTAKGSKKLWVEESGNTSYWKVYGKAGNPAYVSRDCF